MCRLTTTTYSCTSPPAYSSITARSSAFSLQPEQPLQHTVEVRPSCIFRRRLEHSFTTKPASLYAYLTTYCAKDSECSALHEKVEGICPACVQAKEEEMGREEQVREWMEN